MRNFLLFLFIPIIAFSKSVVYKVRFSFLPAGKIEINIDDQKVVVKGKTKPPISWFYHYKLYMFYDLKNATRSYLYEEEGKKKRNYDFQKILQKKPWLPIVVNMLSLGREKAPKNLKIKNIQVVLVKNKKDLLIYNVFGSKNVKKIYFINWKNNDFPEKIVIDTGEATLELEKD